MKLQVSCLFSKEDAVVTPSNLGKEQAYGLHVLTLTLWLYRSEFVKKGGAWLVLMSICRDFHEEGKMPLFLVLVPKKGKVEDLRDFRLNNLVGSLYKLLSLVLAKT